MLVYSCALLIYNKKCAIKHLGPTGRTTHYVAAILNMIEEPLKCFTPILIQGFFFVTVQSRHELVQPLQTLNDLFSHRNFVVTTVSSIVHVKALESETHMLLKKECEPLRAVACHPKQSTVAMGNGNGVLKVWDYNSKTIVCSRTFENADIRCLAFDSQGMPTLAD